VPDFKLGNALNVCRFAVQVQIASHFPTKVKNTNRAVSVMIRVEDGALGKNWCAFFHR
jgi:hypothetical protein